METSQNVFRLDAPRPLELVLGLKILEVGAVVGREVVVCGDEVSRHDEGDEDGDENARVLDGAQHLTPEWLDLCDADVVLCRQNF